LTKKWLKSLSQGSSQVKLGYSCPSMQDRRTIPDSASSEHEDKGDDLSPRHGWRVACLAKFSNFWIAVDMDLRGCSGKKAISARTLFICTLLFLPLLKSIAFSAALLRLMLGVDQFQRASIIPDDQVSFFSSF